MKPIIPITKITALGLSGSGKSCYILGLYAQMAVGVNSFTITATNDNTRKLIDETEILGDKGRGMNRFPSGTSLNDRIDYKFRLNYQSGPIMAVKWMDYAGGLLRDLGANSDVYSELEETIKNSSALCIFIDGEDLCYSTFEEKKEKVAWHCALKINPFITKFSNSHNNNLPPIIFVITKVDLCRQYIKDEDEIYKIISECFSSVFGERTENVYITSVTLGRNISDNEYTGKAAPCMHIPFFIGLYHKYSLLVERWEKDLDSQIQGMIKAIDNNETRLEKEDRKWIFVNTQRIDELREEIEKLRSNKTQSEKRCDDFRSKLKEVENELRRNSNDFITIKNGQKVQF